MCVCVFVCVCVCKSHSYIMVTFPGHGAPLSFLGRAAVQQVSFALLLRGGDTNPQGTGVGRESCGVGSCVVRVSPLWAPPAAPPQGTVPWEGLADQEVLAALLRPPRWPPHPLRPRGPCDATPAAP